MVPFVQSTAIVTEILTMTCIAVERHQGIVHPLKMKWQYTNRRAFTMLGKVKLQYSRGIHLYNDMCNWYGSPDIYSTTEVVLLLSLIMFYNVTHTYCAYFPVSREILFQILLNWTDRFPCCLSFSILPVF